MQTSAHAAEAQLARKLGLWSSIGIVIGVTIGSGIFRTPATIAARVPDPTQMLLVWLLGGAISLCGALSIAELAAALPQTGGLYVYLRESWGRATAFLLGWAELVLIRASAVGAISTVFGEYLMRSLGYDPAAYGRATDCVAAGAIVVAAAINIRGVQIGAAIAGISTIAKFGALVLLVLAAFVLGQNHGAAVAHFSSQAAVQPELFGFALMSVLWAYDGFADVSFAAGEVTQPARTLPRAIVGGTLAIIAIYLAVNAAYLYVNPIAVVAASPLIAADTMGALFGDIGTALISVVVTISTFGALISVTLTAPRVFFAMAADGLFFRPVAAVHPRYGTPYVAIALAALLGATFVMTRTFEQLADTFVLAIWPFYGLAIAGLYRLRRTRPTLTRPYLVPGYPVVPAIFICAVVYLAASALIADPVWTSVTFGVVLAGVPVYFALARR